MENVKNGYQKQVGKRGWISDVITPENVKQMSELLTVTAFRGFFKYSHSKDFEIMYKCLLKDIGRTSDSKFNFSDGYDIVQDVICFLCEHMGENLNDIFRINSKGKSISIKVECLRLVQRKLATKQRRAKNVCIEEIYSLETPEVELDKTHAVVDETIRKMELTEGLHNVLMCRMAGNSYSETGIILSLAMSTVWERMTKVKERYHEKILCLG